MKNVFVALFIVSGMFLDAYATASALDAKPSAENAKNVEKSFDGKSENSIKTQITIAIVKMRDVAGTSLAGKGIDEQLRKINEAAKAKLLPLEEQVKKASENMKTDEVRMEEIQAALYDTIRTERYRISDAADRAIEQLREAMKKAVANVAGREHCIVLDSEAVLFGDVKDITKDVVDELNKICPKVEVKLDQVKK